MNTDGRETDEKEKISSNHEGYIHPQIFEKLGKTENHKDPKAQRLENQESGGKVWVSLRRLGRARQNVIRQ
jgi:hypothetical protein